MVSSTKQEFIFTHFRETPMFATLSQSWEFAKLSYGMVLRHRQLLIFPILSTLAGLIVTASFLLPLWGMGMLEQLTATAAEEGEATTAGQMFTLVIAFLFYFCQYFVIVFFNCALIACAMQSIRGQTPTLGAGLSAAMSRLPQIAGWAALSAVVGMLLKSLERNRQTSAFVTAILGSAWTALTYFAVPFIIMEGTGPVASIKRSYQTLKETWGTALVGNFSLGLLGFLAMLPGLLLAGLIIMSGLSSASNGLLALGIAVAVVLLVIGFTLSSAADIVFKAILFHHATGDALPDDIDRRALDRAFVSQP